MATEDDQSATVAHNKREKAIEFPPFHKFDFIFFCV